MLHTTAAHAASRASPLLLLHGSVATSTSIQTKYCQKLHQ
jgi:hypothetical protein